MKLANEKKQPVKWKDKVRAERTTKVKG